MDRKSKVVVDTYEGTVERLQRLELARACPRGGTEELLGSISARIIESDQRFMRGQNVYRLKVFFFPNSVL